jgi:hypothetical protein
VPYYSSAFLDAGYIKLLKLDCGYENMKVLWTIQYFEIFASEFFVLIL